MGLCTAQGNLLQQSDGYPSDLTCALALDVAKRSEPRLALAGGPVLVSSHPVLQDRGSPNEPAAAPFGMAMVTAPSPNEPGSMASPSSPVSSTRSIEPRVAGRLVLLHDLSFIERRSQDTRRYLIGFIAALGLVMALITMVVAQLSWRGWVAGVRALLRGEGLHQPDDGSSPPAMELRRSRPTCASACATWRTSTAASQGPRGRLERRAAARAAA